MPFEKLAERGTGERSEAMRARVIAARQIQEARFANEPNVHCNAQMGSRLIQQHVVLDDQSRAILEKMMTKYDMSARAYDRILKVARTIADLAGSPGVTADHIREACGYRNLDRGSWGASTSPLPIKP